jgi:hypothetical protein
MEKGGEEMIRSKMKKGVWVGQISLDGDREAPFRMAFDPHNWEPETGFNMREYHEDPLSFSKWPSHFGKKPPPGKCARIENIMVSSWVGEEEEI